MVNKTVLVTAAGSIVSQGIIKALRLANKTVHETNAVNYSIVATDMSPTAAGLYRSDSGHIVPPASSEGFIDAVVSLCRKNAVDAIFIGSDDELQKLAESRKRIENESDAKLLVCSSQALSIARDKWRTFEFCREKSLPVAPTALPEDAASLASEYGYPLVVKPREGYGSVHVYVAKSQEEVGQAIERIEGASWKPIVQKFIGGDEFTSGVTVDRSGKYAMSSISIRKFLKHGQTHKAFIEDNQSVRKSAEEVALKLGVVGPANIQVRIDSGQPAVIEINPRFSATCPMRAVAGVNEPDIVFRNAVLGQEIKVEGFRKLVCLRYWNEVYVQESAVKDAELAGFVEDGKSASFVPDYF
ncbi:MAG: ATP-grasp domain-containing protein [Nitrososphaera sp.]